MTGRDVAGRFAAGFSPDRGRGRQPASPPTGMSTRLASSIMEIANLPVKIREPGRQRRRTVSLFEMMVLRLAMGRTSRRRSVLPFIKLVIGAARSTQVPGQPAPAPTPPAVPDKQLGLAKANLDFATAHGSDDEIDGALDLYLALLRRSAGRKAGSQNRAGG